MRIRQKKHVDHCTNYNADGVCDKVLPRKDASEYEMTQRGVTNIRQPRRIAKLEKLNPERESKRLNAQKGAGGRVKNSAQTKENHQCPKDIARVFTQEGRKNLPEMSRGEAGENRENESEKIPCAPSESNFQEVIH
jgi:hypothetical protein